MEEFTVIIIVLTVMAFAIFFSEEKLVLKALKKECRYGSSNTVYSGSYQLVYHEGVYHRPAHIHVNVEDGSNKGSYKFIHDITLDGKSDRRKEISKIVLECLASHRN